MRYWYSGCGDGALICGDGSQLALYLSRAAALLFRRTGASLHRQAFWAGAEELVNGAANDVLARLRLAGIDVDDGSVIATVIALLVNLVVCRAKSTSLCRWNRPSGWHGPMRTSRPSWAGAHREGRPGRGRGWADWYLPAAGHRGGPARPDPVTVRQRDRRSLFRYSPMHGMKMAPVCRSATTMPPLCSTAAA